MYHLIFDLAMFAVVFKALTIGSGFNLCHWVKHGKEYRTWYNNRPKFSKRIDPENLIGDIMDKTNEWRVVWKIKGKTYSGQWNQYKEVIELWVKKLNEDFSEVHHWCESRR